MGITGLLPFVKRSQKHSHLSEFKGYTAGVDGFCWLHKGAYGCAVKLVMGQQTDSYVAYFMKYINVLLKYGIKPIVVFDGRSLPSKEVTNKKRRESRAENKQKGKELLAQGKDKAAYECFIKSIEITHQMVRSVIQVLQNQSIDYIVAPYEADAQLTFLANKGMVDIVITEDSDLIPFGCPKVLFKLKLSGDCDSFDNANIHTCMDIPIEKFEFDKFRKMCILSGCDYLPSLPGIGLQKAKSFCKLLTTQDIRKALKELPSVLKLDLEVPDEYIDDFVKAENTFLYQVVFDPTTRKLVPLTEYLPNVDCKDMPYAGTYDLSNEVALQMCIGNIDTKDLKTVSSRLVLERHMGYGQRTSIWSRHYVIPHKRNIVTELKNATKHSSTAGLKALVPLRTISIKRRLNVKEEEGEEDLVSLYASIPKVTVSNVDNDQQCHLYVKSHYWKDSNSPGESPTSKKTRTAKL